MSKSNNSNGSSIRWWEFYAVRYAMGTIVGAVIFYSLCIEDDALKKLLILPKDGKLESYHFILLGIYGLIYCYVASAPILVLHAARFLFTLPAVFKLRDLIRPIGILGLPFIIGIIFWYLTPSKTNESNVKLNNAAVMFMVALIIIPQWFLVIKTLLNTDKLFDFYKRLSKRRTECKIDIKDSYKHLREHGNSFGIVFFEIVFGIILYVIGLNDSALVSIASPNFSNTGPYIIVLFFWILPASLVWVIGIALEQKFANDSTDIPPF